MRIAIRERCRQQLGAVFKGAAWGYPPRYLKVGSENMGYGERVATGYADTKVYLEPQNRERELEKREAEEENVEVEKGLDTSREVATMEEKGCGKGVERENAMGRKDSKDGKEREDEVVDSYLIARAI